MARRSSNWSRGAIYVETESELLVTNCTFVDNSAQNVAGAISATSNVTLDIQKTAFVGNKAFLHDGGAIDVQEQVHLSVTNCVFKDNSAQVAAGAVYAMMNVTLDIQATRFVGNKAGLEELLLVNKRFTSQ